MRRGVVRIEEQTMLDMLGLGPGVILRSVTFDVVQDAVLAVVDGAGLPAEFERVPGLPLRVFLLKELTPHQVQALGIR